MKKGAKRISLSTITILVAISIVTAAAAVYIMNQARMTVFEGVRIEQKTDDPNAPMLFLKSHGIDVGQNANIADEDVVFPVLGEVGSKFPSDPLAPAIWEDESGQTAVTAQSFVLSAKNGNIDDVKYKIVIKGDASAGKALRFGVTTSYYSEEENCTINSARTVFLDSNNNSESEAITLGDGNVLEGEDIKITVSAWVDSATLAEIGEYDNAGFSVELVFLAESET